MTLYTFPTEDGALRAAIHGARVATPGEVAQAAAMLGEASPDRVTVPGYEHARWWCLEHRHRTYTGAYDAPGPGHTACHSERRRWAIACPAWRVPLPPGAPCRLRTERWTWSELMQSGLDELELSVRADHALDARLGCNSIADVVCLSPAQVLSARGCGRKTLAEIEEELARHRLRLGMGERL